MSKRIFIKGILGCKSGYGKFTTKLVEDLVEHGYDVHFRPLNSYDQSDLTDVKPFVMSKLVFQDQKDDCHLTIHPPDNRAVINKNSINFFFTMWEPTRVPAYVSEHLKTIDTIIAPSSHCITSFSDFDWRTRIALCKLGYNAEVYKYSEFEDNGMFTFLMAACNDGGFRKGTKKTIKAFREAFPEYMRDVQLVIKATDRCEDKYIIDEEDSYDPRIKIIKSFIPDEAMANLYRKCDCLVLPSMGEGFGLHAIEAMATGRPVIGPKFSGLADFMDENNSFLVDYDMIKSGAAHADQFYKNAGMLCNVIKESLSIKMIEAYQIGKKGCELMGQNAAKTASQFTSVKSMNRLIEVLETRGFF